jgi:hypothetical protein
MNLKRSSTYGTNKNESKEVIQDPNFENRTKNSQSTIKMSHLKPTIGNEPVNEEIFNSDKLKEQYSAGKGYRKSLTAGDTCPTGNAQAYTGRDADSKKKPSTELDVKNKDDKTAFSYTHISQATPSLNEPKATPESTGMNKGT